MDLDFSKSFMICIFFLYDYFNKIENSLKTEEWITKGGNITREPVQNGPILFTKVLSYFSETTDQSQKYAAKACTEEQTLASSYTWNQSLILPQCHIIRTWMMESFQRQGSIVQEDLVLMTISYKWPSSKVLQLKLSHQHFYIPDPTTP